MQPDIDHVSHHREVFGEFGHLNHPASVPFKLASGAANPNPNPNPKPQPQPEASAMVWPQRSALSTLPGDDKNGKGETMTAAEICFYVLSPTQRGRGTHPEATGGRGKLGGARQR